MSTTNHITKLNYEEFFNRIQELATDFAQRYSDSSPMFPWYFVLRNSQRYFDSHVHLCSFQAYEDSSNGYQNIEGPLNEKADIQQDDHSIREMYSQYCDEFNDMFGEEEEA